MLIKRKKFQITQQIKKLPNGNSVRMDIIVHPGAALIVPFIKKDQIIMLRQWRPALGKYLFELPAGTVDPGESILTCARRELIEETGYFSKEIVKLGQIYPVPGYSTEIIHIYKAEQLQFCDGQQEPDEVLTQKVFSKVQIQKMFSSGQIQDGKSICALTMCGWL